MVSEVETPLDDDIEEIDDVLEEPSDDAGVEEAIDDVAVLRAEINSLKEQVARPAWLNELKTIEGRVRSAEARLMRAEDPQQQRTLRAELEQRINDSNTLIQAMLNGIDDSVFTDPSIKQKAQQYIAMQQQAANEAALIEKVRNEIRSEQPRQAPQQEIAHDWSPEVKVWERTRVKQIQNAGLDPDSEDWAPVWQAAAAALVNNDFDSADGVIDSHLSELMKEREAASSRNVAKSRAKSSPTASGGSKGALDPSRSNADRIAYLRSIGAI